MARHGFKAILTYALTAFGEGTSHYDQIMSDYYAGSAGKKGKGRNRSGGSHVPRTKGNRSASLKSRSNRQKRRA